MKPPWRSTRTGSAPREIRKPKDDGGRPMPLADTWGQSLQLRWPICKAPAGTNAATYLRVPAEHRGYLLPLSGVHLERQLIQGGEGWRRRLASSLIPTATNSIICSVLRLRVSFALSVSLLPSPPTIPISVCFLHKLPFSSLFWAIVLFFLLYSHVSSFTRADFSLSGKKKQWVLCWILEYIMQC